MQSLVARGGTIFQMLELLRDLFCHPISFFAMQIHLTQMYFAFVYAELVDVKNAVEQARDSPHKVQVMGSACALCLCQ